MDTAWMVAFVEPRGLNGLTGDIAGIVVKLATLPGTAAGLRETEEPRCAWPGARG